MKTKKTEQFWATRDEEELKEIGKGIRKIKRMKRERRKEDGSLAEVVQELGLMMQRVDKEKAQKGSSNVCAWCRSTYDETGVPLRKLSDEEYRQVKSHGVCGECSDKMKKEMR